MKIKWTSESINPARIAAQTTYTSSGIHYIIQKKKDGRVWVDAYKGGGAKVQLPFQDFETVKEAKFWVGNREVELEERRERAKDDFIML